MNRGGVLNNPDVQSDIDMKGFALLNTPAGTGDFDNVTLTDVHNFTTKEVWIASDRTDGKGMGTQVDPYDGSTKAKIKTILDAISTGTTVHFGPGTFETDTIDDSTNKGFRPKANCKYIGAGRGVTTFKVVSSDNTNHYAAVFNMGGSTADGVEVRNMTIDCNGAALVAANSSDFKTDGIGLKGANCVISNVHLIHVYGHQATGREAFGLCIDSSKNGLIENCLVDTFASGYDDGSMIGFIGDSTGGGIVRDCEVNGQTTDTAAFVAYGSNITIDHCRAINCKQFVYADTGNIDHLTIRGCTANGITYAFANFQQAPAYSHHDIVIDGCFVDFGATGALFFAASASDATHLYNITLSNNISIQSTGSSYVPYAFTSVDNFSEKGNLWMGNPHLLEYDWISAGANYSPHFQCGSQNTNSALVGSIKVTGNFTSGGTLYYQFNPANYTVLSGDKLKYEIYLDESDASSRVSTYVLFSDSTYTSTARDQNGIAGYDNPGSGQFSDIGLFAKGRWYAREFDLTSFAGKISQYFYMAYLGNDTAQTGVHTFYIRNIRIVDKSGLLKRKFYAEGDSAPTLASQSNVSAYSATIVANALGYTAENVANKSQVNGYASLDGTGKVPAAELPTLASGTIATTSAVLKGDGAGNAVAATQTGTGDAVLATSPTLITPTIGVATATSVNKWTLTAPTTAATLTAGADNCTYTFPAISCNIGFREIPNNSQSTSYTGVLTDNGKCLFHPASDANARTFTIPANASVAYPVGTVLVFENMSANAVTIAITSDTLYMAGAGTTGSRTLAQYGRAVARKFSTTEWLIDGSALT